MYIWVVLATFIAMLASFMLPSRDDIRKVTVEPLAEAQVAKLVTKHRSACSYAQANTPPNTPAGQVTYVLGVLGSGIINPYMPKGYVNDPAYTTQIFCLDKTWMTVFSAVASCDMDETSRMVITYGEIPQRWLNVNTGMPNNDYINAMMTTVNSKTRFGYGKVISGSELNDPMNISNSNMKIVGREDAGAYIPKAIVNDATFKAKCGPASGKYCLIYLSGI